VHQTRLKAAIAWYGPLGSATSPQQPDVVGDLKVPVLGLYGGKDKATPLDQIEAMKAKLAAAGGAAK
jgi:carboxymethylenebutenolidase